MNDKGGGLGAGAQIGLLFAGALVVVLGFTAWLIGAAQLFTLALILVVAFALAVVIFAAAFPIKAWRAGLPVPPVVQEHFYHDGTKIIEREKVLDGRMIEAPKLYQLPAQPAGAAFPDMLRAAFQAGTLAPRGTAARYEGAVDAEVNDMGPVPDGWDGDIR